LKVSSRVDYALSCAIRVADKYEENKPVPVSFIAKKEKIEPDYAEQLLSALKKSRIVKSVRGPGGGYVLAKAPSKITARDIVVAINKEVLKLVCFRKKVRRRKCAHFDDCKVRSFWLDLKDQIDRCMVKYSLEDLVVLRRQEKNW
jgi:Rrf2 family iron-sulfur cluster assembly transcriptional regulator